MTGVNVTHERAAYRTIDFTRAAAAIAVVWNHCFNMLLEPVTRDSDPFYHVLARTASCGRDAVMIFFVISGYWISRSVTNSVGCGSWSWRHYLVNRLSRLWIVLLPALVLGLLLDIAGRFLLDVPPYRALGWQGTDFVDVGKRISASIALGNALFLQDLMVPSLGSNSALWTLSKELWYYIWFPTLFLLTRRRIDWLALLATAVTGYLSGISTLLFACWLAGAVVAWVEGLYKPRAGERPGVIRATATMLAIACWIGCSIAARYPGLNYYAGCFLISGGFAVLLSCILRFDVDIPRLLWPVARYGNGASFSLYAYHLPVLVAIMAIVFGGYTMPLSAGGVIAALAVCLALIAGGAAFAFATERRTDRLRDVLARSLSGSRRLSVIASPLRPNASRKTDR